jgi:hypothetical protein
LAHTTQKRVFLIKHASFFLFLITFQVFFVFPTTGNCTVPTLAPLKAKMALEKLD